MSEAQRAGLTERVLAAVGRVYMLEIAVYSVISPEGCASILWKDPAKADIAAGNLKLTAQNALTHLAIEGIITEHDLGASSFYARIREFTNGRLAEYKWIRILEFAPSISKTISGKLCKAALRQ